MKKSFIAASILFAVFIVGCEKYESENNRALEGSVVQNGESECPGGDDEDPLPMLRGTVIDTLSLDSLQGVCVNLTSDEDVFVAVIGTDSDGHYYFNQVASGNYKLVFSKLGYVTKTLPIVVSTSAQTINAQLREIP